MRFLKNIYHYLFAHFSAFIHRYPSKDIFVVGVTGTKGKTSTVELINAGLEAAGYKTALNSSLRRKVGDKVGSNRGNSMFGRFYLQQFLKDAKNAKCDFAIIEVTSEGVVQSRHRGIHFDAAIFTGLHPEHIESHGSFEKYRDAKLSFFQYVKNWSKKPAKLFFINIEDDNGRHFIEAAGKGSDTKIALFVKSKTPSNLEGEFNKINIGAAESFLTAIGVPDETIKKTFLEFKGTPGRMEKVVSEPFQVYVDYAHTPASLEAVYRSLSKNYKLKTTNSRLICVLGSAGGGRDKWKRPEFGKIAGEYCDEIILTNEDPYDEKPEEILEEIESGILNSKNYQKIIDRKEAIRKALSLAKPGDTVILTGKGSEKSIHLAHGKTIPWSERDAVLEALNKSV